LKELINPIDDERLKLDSVHNVKETVRNFYLKKNQQCEGLLAELDLMTSERPELIKLKKKFFGEATGKYANQMMLETKLKAGISRIS
jgi:hypothetical protein